jgi:toxin-antitoxin system PIN domain toxin
VSFAIDVNVLLCASDSASPRHPQAEKFLERCAGRGEVLCLGWPTVMSYLRISTHPAVFARPLTHAHAMRNVEALLALPHARVLAEGEGFWDVYREVARAVPTRGNFVANTHLAALLRYHGVPMLYTLDRDFRKFDFLDVRDPFAQPGP